MFVVFKVAQDNTVGLSAGLYAGGGNSGSDFCNWVINQYGSKFDGNYYLDEDGIEILWGGVVIDKTTTYQNSSGNPTVAVDNSDLSYTLQQLQQFLINNMTVQQPVLLQLEDAIAKLTELTLRNDAKFKEAVEAEVNKVKRKVESKYADIDSSFWE